MVRRKESEVRGGSMRPHVWKVIRTEGLSPIPPWQQEELEREAKLGILEKPVEMERSPPMSPGRSVRVEPAAPAAPAELVQLGTIYEYPSTSTPQPTVQPTYHQDESGDVEPAPPRLTTGTQSMLAHPIPHDHNTRKPVCDHCWDDNLRCDSRALCGNCSSSGHKCVYMHCRFGAQCGRARCPYIHPGQWNEHDPAWTVEQGSLRPKPNDPPKRMSRDHPEVRIDPRLVGRGSARKRARSPSGRDGHGDALEDGFIRKSICVHCYYTSSLCDFNGRCATCTGKNIKCVRILCKQGLSCRAPRCPCVHPGQ